jgi:hypothetical protein
MGYGRGPNRRLKLGDGHGQGKVSGGGPTLGQALNDVFIKVKVKTTQPTAFY